MNALTRERLYTIPLLHLYRGVRRSGLLELSLFRRLFRLSYFTYKRYLEDPFYNLASKHPRLFENGHVIDVGANVGYTSLVFSKAISKDLKVFSFEPEPINFAQLEELLGEVSGVELIQSAVGSKNGSVDLLIKEESHADHQVLIGKNLETLRGDEKVITTSVVTIDSFAREHQILDSIGFVKVDVQGYELPVCLGMTEVLTRNPGVSVVLEYAPFSLEQLGFRAGELLEFMQARGFVPYLLDQSGELTRTSPSGLEAAVGDTDYRDVLFTKVPV